MFDRLVRTATSARGVSTVAAWARVENAASARRLSAMADELERQLDADGSADREQWVMDNWDAVCAEIAAAQSVSLGVASHQVVLALALRERLPAVAQVFADGRIGLQLVKAIVARTHLAQDPEVGAKIDAEIAAHVDGWTGWSVAKTEAAIDYWVDRYDPHAVVRTEHKARGRYVDIHHDDATGVSSMQATLLIHGGAALDARLEAMARAVCDADPRTVDQRRSDALAALGDGAQHLRCGCESEDCDAAAAVPSTTVVHVIAEQASLTDDTPATLDGDPDPAPTGDQPRGMTIAEALAPEPGTGPAATNPAWVFGAGMLPAPLLAATLAKTARIEPIVHPGNAAPERRYIPSKVLATFVRCRDMTCRFPGCDAPAWGCDIDHTIAYPHGATQAANLKCLCRKHHLLKTFWGWRDHQWPDGTVVWTSPLGQTFTTHPGSRLWFPSLCRPTAPVVTTDVPDTTRNRALMMPRRALTRAQSRRQDIEAERARNQQLREDPGNDGDDAYFPPRPRPPSDDDPPPF
jgi:Domain of unknown function (DUF222)